MSSPLLLSSRRVTAALQGFYVAFTGSFPNHVNLVGWAAEHSPTIMTILQLWVQLQGKPGCLADKSYLAALFYHILADGSWSHDGTTDIHLMSIATMAVDIQAG